MLRKSLMYGSLTLVSIAAGIMIGGGPEALRSTPAADVPVVMPTTTPAATTSAPAPDTTATTSPPATTLPASTTTEATTTTTEATTTTTTTLPEPVDRGALRVVVANGSGVQGIAGRFAAALGEVGYGELTPLNAEQIETTTVYHGPDTEAEARRLAQDAGFDADAIAPFDEMPELLTDQDIDVDLVLVLGVDNQDAPPTTVVSPAEDG